MEEIKINIHETKVINNVYDDEVKHKKKAIYNKLQRLFTKDDVIDDMNIFEVYYMNFSTHFYLTQFN